MRLKITLKNIQSFSDIITNSSSELFVRISADKMDVILSGIENELNNLFRNYDSSEYEMFDYISEGEAKELIKDRKRWNPSWEPTKIQSKRHLSGTRSIHVSDFAKEIHKYAIEQILNESIGEGNYEIEWVHEEY